MRFTSKERELLAPLAKIRHLKHFQIILPWKQEDSTLWDDAPFSISREFKNVERFGVSIPILGKSW